MSMKNIAVNTNNILLFMTNILRHSSMFSFITCFSAVPCFAFCDFYPYSPPPFPALRQEGQQSGVLAHAQDTPRKPRDIHSVCCTFLKAVTCEYKPTRLSAVQKYEQWCTTSLDDILRKMLQFSYFFS